MADTRRYWDGAKWTSHIAPMDPKPAAPARGPAANDYKGLVAGGVAMAIIFPVVGFVIGAFLLAKRPGPGVGIMVISLIAAVVWYSQLTGSSGSGGY